MRDERAGDQADAAGEQDEHYYRVKKAGRLKIDLQIHQDAREDDYGERQDHDVFGNGVTRVLEVLRDRRLG